MRSVEAFGTWVTG